MIKYFIKNMVCERCIDSVKKIFGEHKIIDIKLGIIKIEKVLSINQKNKLELELKKNGFELLDNKSKILINNIKSIIIKKINDLDLLDFNLKDNLNKELNYNYSYLSRVFSKNEGISIEKYLISQKIEKAKELISYNELSISEISILLGYNSISHFSRIFKKNTGFNARDYSKLTNKKRVNIDKLGKNLAL